MTDEILYLKIDRNVLVTDPVVKLSDIASMECTKKGVVPKLKQKIIYRFHKLDTGKKKNQLAVFSILKIIELIHEEYPTLTVDNQGETDFILEYQGEEQDQQWLQNLKTGVLCIIIFFGGAFTIMAFNNDISITELFDKFYYRVMGAKSDGFTELEFGYAIGMALGILIFFNHIGKKKITHDPTPIQVEMRKYEQDIDTTFVENISRKEHNIDVD